METECMDDNLHILSGICYLIFLVTTFHCRYCGTSFKPKEEFLKHGYRVHVQNVGLYSNQRRGSRCMETEFMDDNLPNQIRNRFQEENVQNVGHHSNQRRSSGNMDTEFMMDVKNTFFSAHIVT